MGEVWYASISELSHSFATRALSPVEVTSAILQRIERLDSRLHSYITVASDLALRAARASEARFARGAPLGPLDGVPIGLKDLFDTAGVRTTAHSALYAERVPDRDAEVVRRLHEAGAILIGKHAMYEFAMGKVETDEVAPPARSPWDPGRITGGSSSGSGVAVAAGLCTAALGSDTGGSIRSPAAYCGVVGLKPTYGLVSRRGVIPLSWSLDHVGPLARSVADAALLLQCIAGHDPRDHTSARVSVPDALPTFTDRLDGVRIGAPLAHVDSAKGLDPQNLAAYRAALATLEALGARIVELGLPPELEAAGTTRMTIQLAEAFAVHRAHLADRSERLGRKLRERLLEGVLFTGADLVQAHRARAIIARAMARATRAVDAIVTPSTLRPPWPTEEDDGVSADARTFFFQLFNLTGQPAITIPSGRTPDGLPIGLQVVAPPFHDALAMRVALAFELATEWSAQRPPAA